MKKQFHRLPVLFLILIAFALTGFTLPADSAPAAPANVLLLKYDGPVTSVMVDYISRGIQEAEAGSYSAIVFQMNTPGGSVELMNRVVQVIRNSKVPVIVYIAPKGAMAVLPARSSLWPVTRLPWRLKRLSALPVLWDPMARISAQRWESKVKEILKATVRSLAKNRGPKAIELAQQTIESRAGGIRQ